MDPTAMAKPIRHRIVGKMVAKRLGMTWRQEQPRVSSMLQHGSVASLTFACESQARSTTTKRPWTLQLTSEPIHSHVLRRGVRYAPFLLHHSTRFLPTLHL